MSTQPADLVGQRILVLKSVSLITDQKVARPLSLELICVQAKGLIGDNQHLQRAANERASRQALLEAAGIHAVGFTYMTRLCNDTTSTSMAPRKPR